jgi:hypothetical protein
MWSLYPPTSGIRTSKSRRADQFTLWGVVQYTIKNWHK